MHTIFILFLNSVGAAYTVQQPRNDSSCRFTFV